MDFKPLYPPELKRMDARIFRRQDPMGHKKRRSGETGNDAGQSQTIPVK